MENSRVLVTGGAGFLGSNLVKRLAACASRVWVVDDLYTGRRDAVPDADNVCFVHASVSDGAMLREILPEVDYIFHFAARNIMLSVTNPETDFCVNTAATVQLLLNALPYGSQIKRVVYASTSSVYGDCSVLPVREDTYRISVPYAASKLSAELFAIAYARTYGLPVTCLRFSNVYGPGQVSTNPYCGVVSKFMQAILDGQPLTIFGDGTQTRDFTFVEDAMAATVLAATSERTIGQVLNVGTGIETSVQALAEQIKQIAGCGAHPVVYRAKRPVDTVQRRAVDASRLRELTEWRPMYTLQEGLERTWVWFLNANQT